MARGAATRPTPTTTRRTRPQRPDPEGNAMLAIFRTTRRQQMESGAHHTAPTEALPAEPAEPERWVPEGTVVPTRFTNLAGADVLLFRSACGTWKHAVLCLGCGYASRGEEARENGRQGANDHASTCRAQPSPPPPVPTDTEAASLVAYRLRYSQDTTVPKNLHLEQFTVMRPQLRRDDAWIHRELAALADRDPSLLTVRMSEPQDGSAPQPQYTIQPRPAPPAPIQHPSPWQHTTY